jgi:hypothetical protein
MKHQGMRAPLKARRPRSADRVASLFRAVSRRSMTSVCWTGFELVRLPQSSVGREQQLNQHHGLIIEAERW